MSVSPYCPHYTENDDRSLGPLCRECDEAVYEAEHQGRKVMGMMTGSSRTRLDWLIREYDVQSVIEVGSFCGLSACFFAERVASVVCVDHWDLSKAYTMAKRKRGYPEDVYQEFLLNTAAYPNITHYRMDSLRAAAELDVGADLVFIDGDHSFDGVVADIRAWTPHARKVLCGDDNQKVPVNAAIMSLGIPDSGERIWWQAI